MSMTNRRIALLEGSYMGWVRNPSSEDWEDMIGMVKVSTETTVEVGVVNVAIKTLEFGTWSGEMRTDTKVLQGPTGQGNIGFRLTLEQRDLRDRFENNFRGGIFDEQDTLLLEISLTASVENKLSEDYFVDRVRSFREYFAGTAGELGRNDFHPGAALCDRWLSIMAGGATVDQAMALFEDYHRLFIEEEHFGGTGWERCRALLLDWLAFIFDGSPEISNCVFATLAGLFRQHVLTEERYSTKWAPGCAAFCDQWLALIEQTDLQATRELRNQVGQLPQAIWPSWEVERFIGLWAQRLFSRGGPGMIATKPGDLPAGITTQHGDCSEYYGLDILLDGEKIGSVIGTVRNLDNAVLWLKRARIQGATPEEIRAWAQVLSASTHAGCDLSGVPCVCHNLSGRFLGPTHF